MKKTQRSFNSTIKPIGRKQREKNALWRAVCIERAFQLMEKYGHIICEYSGETIYSLSSMGDDMNDGWGHHIDGDRNNITLENCYICKYKYHTIITDGNIKVSQEDYKTREFYT